MPGIVRLLMSEDHMSGITKSMLIERIAIRYPALPPRDVELAVKAVFERMTRQLVEGGRIELRGFGSFSLHKRRARVGRNPKTGESVVLDTKAVPHFKPGKELREAVNRTFLDLLKS